MWQRSDLKADQFALLNPSIAGNPALRVPQAEAFQKISEHFASEEPAREVGLVLPVGCGKSGLLALAPFAVGAKRALLVAPNVGITGQLVADLTPSSDRFFYEKRGVLDGDIFPELAEIRGTSTNLSDLESADIVVTNIQQLQRDNNKWLSQLDEDFFDLIMFDEGHHNVAESWDTLRAKFPRARIINVSGTPSRADGRLMAGEIIYNYPIREAVRNGYVKRISGHRLNPRTLRYVRRDGDDSHEIEVDLDEVKRLGEEDASFRRSIVSSDESLSTIADASIRKLRELRERSGDNRLKIIASALNMEHCKQIVAKYTERGLRADFVHSRQEGRANDLVHSKLDRHELDVIVQVRKLGEGFDHPLLAVAAVFSIFSNLGPFVQFVGRIMRVIPGIDPFDQENEGVVVFHVGANITGVWQDFQEFAEADRDWLAQLVDEDIPEGLDEDDVDPLSDVAARPAGELPTITSQDDVRLEDLELLSGDPLVAEAMRLLREAGVSTGEQFEQLRRIQPTRQASRQAKRKLLDERIKTKVGQILGRRHLQHGGRDLDRTRRGRNNFQVIKGAIDRQANSSVGQGTKSRSQFSQEELDQILLGLDEIAETAERELFSE